MKYNCNACGRYVEAGSGHDCYKPRKPRREVEQLQSLCESYRHDLDRERKRIVELEAELQALREVREAAQDVHDNVLGPNVEGTFYKVQADFFDALAALLQEQGDD